MREGWVALVAMITGQRRTPLHRGKSDVLGGAVSWADDLKVGEESLAPYSPDLSPLLLGVRKCQGLQAAHNNPSAQGNRQRSCGKLLRRSPSRHHDQLQEKMRSLSRV